MLSVTFLKTVVLRFLLFHIHEQQDPQVTRLNKKEKQCGGEICLSHHGSSNHITMTALLAILHVHFVTTYPATIRLTEKVHVYLILV